MLTKMLVASAMAMAAAACTQQSDATYIAHAYAPDAVFHSDIVTCSTHANCAPLCVHVLNLGTSARLIDSRITSMDSQGANVRCEWHGDNGGWGDDAAWDSGDYMIGAITTCDDDDSCDDGGAYGDGSDDGGDSGSDGSGSNGGSDTGSDGGMTGGDGGGDDGGMDGGNDGGDDSGDDGDDGDDDVVIRHHHIVHAAHPAHATPSLNAVPTR